MPYKKDFLLPLIPDLVRMEVGLGNITWDKVIALLVAHITSCRGLRKVQDASPVTLFPPSLWDPFVLQR